MSAEQEKIWLTRIAEGDEQAFRALYNHYSPRIYSFGMHLTRNAPLAEELVQDVFEKLWRRRTSLDGLDNPTAYIRAMVRNTANNQLRRMAHERLILQRLAKEDARQEPSAENDLDQQRFRKVWQQAIDSLPPRVKEVYLLSRTENLKNAEIAQRLGISIYTVKEYLKKALAVIRETLDKHVDLIILGALTHFF